MADRRRGTIAGFTPGRSPMSMRRRVVIGRPCAEALEPRRFFNAAGFVDVINNPMMPLKPGDTWVYKGQSEGDRETDRVVVQSYTKTIKGVTCTVVLDRV